jgi:pyruvate dehydrogenase E2 component (dihydrolipoamide acetyltransferase)
MSYEFKLPDLGEGMAEVEIIEWYVDEDDVVTADQPLVSVETDKLITDISSPVAGRIERLAAAAGDRVPVGATLVLIDAPESSVADETGGSASTATATAATKDAPPATPVRTPAPPPAEPVSARQVRVKAAPATRKLALDLGVAIEMVSGSGPNGRVTPDDVRAAVAGATEQPVPATATNGRAPDDGAALAGPSPPAAGDGARLGDRVPMSATRRQIARNLVESWTRIPQCVDFREVDAGRLVETRREIARVRDGAAPAFGAFMVKFVAATLAQYPVFNARLDEERDEIVIASEINIGVATATPDGVIVPVLRNADRKSIDEISDEIDAIAERSKRRRLAPADLRGGTFTVNNVGALDPTGHAFPTPLINWPEVAILGFGRIHDRVVAVDGAPMVRPTMLLTVTADHRLIDGADIAAFSNRLTDFVREPRLLLTGLH